MWIYFKLYNFKGVVSLRKIEFEKKIFEIKYGNLIQKSE